MISFASSSLDYHDHILWLDTADLPDDGPIIALQVCLGQWPSFTGMEHIIYKRQILYQYIVINFTLLQWT